MADETTPATPPESQPAEPPVTAKKKAAASAEPKDEKPTDEPTEKRPEVVVTSEVLTGIEQSPYGKAHAETLQSLSDDRRAEQRKGNIY